MYLKMYGATQSPSTAFVHGRRLLRAFNVSRKVSSTKRLRPNYFWVSILYYMPVLSSYVCEHAVNADLLSLSLTSLISLCTIPMEC